MRLSVTSDLSLTFYDLIPCLIQNGRALRGGDMVFHQMPIVVTSSSMDPGKVQGQGGITRDDEEFDVDKNDILKFIASTGVSYTCERT
jgi:hypothetical protein